jgi:hypothetical protein
LLCDSALRFPADVENLLLALQLSLGCRPVFGALASAADATEPQASVDIALAYYVLVPVSDVAVEVDSSGCPKFLAFPNVDHFANSSSSVEVVG